MQPKVESNRRRLTINSLINDWILKSFSQQLKETQTENKRAYQFNFDTKESKNLNINSNKNGKSMV